MKKTFSVLVGLLMGMCLASKRAIAQPLAGQIVPKLPHLPSWGVVVFWHGHG